MVSMRNKKNYPSIIIEYYLSSTGLYHAYFQRCISGTCVLLFQVYFQKEAVLLTYIVVHFQTDFVVDICRLFSERGSVPLLQVSLQTENMSPYFYSSQR